MTLIIPIITETLDMIGELNNGLVPFDGTVPENATPAYFLYNGKDTPPEIISHSDMVDIILVSRAADVTDFIIRKVE